SRILVEVCDHHQPPLVIVNTKPVADGPAVLGTLPNVLGSGDHKTVVHIVDRMENRVVVWNIDDGAIGKGEFDPLHKLGEFLGTMKIVGKEEAPAQQIFPQQLTLVFSQP